MTGSGNKSFTQTFESIDMLFPKAMVEALSGVVQWRGQSKGCGLEDERDMISSISDTTNPSDH